MEVLILLVFVSLMLAGSAVAMFAWLARAGTFEHADRMALMPIADERGPRPHSKEPRQKTSGAAVDAAEES